MMSFISLFSIVAAQDKVLLGYLYTWGTKIKISQAVDAGYSAIALAFGKVDGTTVSLLDMDSWNGLLDIAAAKKKGLKFVVVSFGGWFNTFIPNGADVNTLAANMVKFLNDNQLDGIDLDLEHTQKVHPPDAPNIHDREGVGLGKDSTPEERDEYIGKLVKALRAKKPDMIITCAPQVALAPGTGEFQIVNARGEQMYEKAIQDCGFDYVMPQLYNNDGMVWKGVKQDDPTFISKSWPDIVKGIPSKCKKTKVLVGMPSSLKAATWFSIFTKTGKSKDKYGDMCNQFQSLKDESMFQGVMTWSVNDDPQFNFPKKSMYWKTTCPAGGAVAPPEAGGGGGGSGGAGSGGAGSGGAGSGGAGGGTSLLEGNTLIAIVVVGGVLAIATVVLLVVCFKDKSSSGFNDAKKKKLPMNNGKQSSFATGTKKKPRR